MSQRILFRCLCGLATLLLFAACGGGGNSSGTTSSSTGSAPGTVKQGVAVDPYIVGAIFQEVAADGVTVLQRQSTPSDANGVFTFPQPLTAGSTVEMKAADKGLHGGAPFQGLLRRQIGEDEAVSVTVTPLTTLLTQGIDATDALLTLNQAGFNDLTTGDLYGNPMSGLPDLTSGVTDHGLELLQAAMAVEAYLEITDNFRPTLADLSSPANSRILGDMAQAVKSELNAAQFDAVGAALAGDPQITGKVTLGDLILAVVQEQQTLIAQIKDRMAAGGGYDSALVQQIVQNNMSQSVSLVKEQYMSTMPQGTSVDGATLYANKCAGCHGDLANSTKAGRTADQISAAIATVSQMSSLSTLTTTEIQAIADALAGTVATPPATTLDGATLYADNCAGCHGPLATTSKPGRTAADIENAIATVSSMSSQSSLTSAEIQAIADALPPAPATDPGTAPDGVALYDSECSGCHGPLAGSTKAGRTADQITAAIASVSQMSSLSTLTTAEIQAITDALATVVPPPTTTPDGPTLYANDCAGCHGPLATSTKAGRTADQITAAIASVSQMSSLSTLTTAEIQTIADALATVVPPPTTTPDGPTLYANDCAGCHGPLTTSTKAGRTADQITAAIASVSQMSSLSTLTTAEIQAIADALATSSGGGTDYSDCTSCHGQPPNGSSYPNVAGAHAFHTTLASVNNDCAVCHANHAHNGTVDMQIASAFNAESGAATANSDNTCSNISCHGGKTTPDWRTGAIAIETQCTACHASGTSQYNSYFSGQHSRHISRGYACTVCHNTATLATGHFANMATSGFEQDPASTIGGGSTSVTSYTPSSSRPTSGTCLPKCHGSESW